MSRRFVALDDLDAEAALDRAIVPWSESAAEYAAQILEALNEADIVLCRDEPAPAAARTPEPDRLAALADEVAEVTEARFTYAANFGAMGRPGSYVGRMPSERYELALAKILSAVRSILAAPSPSTSEPEA